MVIQRKKTRLIIGRRVWLKWSSVGPCLLLVGAVNFGLNANGYGSSGYWNITWMRFSIKILFTGMNFAYLPMFVNVDEANLIHRWCLYANLQGSKNGRIGFRVKWNSANTDRGCLWSKRPVIFPKCPGCHCKHRKDGIPRSKLNVKRFQTLTVCLFIQIDRARRTHLIRRISR